MNNFSIDDASFLINEICDDFILRNLSVNAVYTKYFSNLPISKKDKILTCLSKAKQQILSRLNVV